MLTLKQLYLSYFKHPEGQWVMKNENAQILFTFVKEHSDKIKNVLDLGTGIGCSAAVIALALKQKGKTDFHIHTVEQYEKCRKLAEELMPAELKEYVTFHRTDVVIWKTDKLPYDFFMNFKELPQTPEGGWDLILTDGPGPWRDENGHLVELPNGDLLDLHMKDLIKPGSFVMFDGRIKAIGFLERFFSDNFFTFEPVNSRCNILERKDNPVFCDDSRIKSYERDGYFKN